MSYRLARIGTLCGPGQVSVDLFDLEGSGAGLLAAESWLLEWYDPQAGFGPCRNAERVLGLSLCRTQADTRILARFSHLAGTYRFTCLDAGADPGWNRCLIHGDPAGREPLYLRVEGLNLHGREIIHSCYLDPSEMPRALSWRVDQAAGLCMAGGFSIRLVDLDGDLTRAFAPRLADRPDTRLAQPLDADSTELHLEQTEGLAPDGFVYIGEEAIRYSGISGTQLEIIERGALATTAAPHCAGARCYAANPHVIGRKVWVRQPRGGAGLSENDPLVFCGLLEELGPDPENLATYRLSISEPLAHLNVPVGRRLASGRLTRLLMVDGEQTVTGRRGNDRLSFAIRRHPALPWEITTLAIAPGGYRTEAGEGGEGHIAHALRRALDESAPGVFTAVFVDERGRLHLRARVDEGLRLLAGERPEIDRDSILPTLGFDLSRLDTLYNGEGAISRPGEGLEQLEFVSHDPIRAGVGPHNRRVFLEPAILPGESPGRFAGGHLARIDDEILYYERLRLDPTTDAPQATLVYPVDSATSLLRVDDASDFPEEGAFVRLGEEIIRYARREGSSLLVGCERGVWASRATPHDPGDRLCVVSVPYLSGCVRGLYGSEPAAHAGGAAVLEVIGSESLSQPRPGLLRHVPGSPFDFLLDLLDATRPGARGGVNFGAFLDRASFERLARQMPLAFGDSFRRLVFPEERVADVVADVCASTGLLLGVSGAGRLALFEPQTRLRHARSLLSLGHADLLGAPVLRWREDLRVTRVEIDFDHHALHDTCASRLVLDDERDGAHHDGQDRCLRIESRCIRSRTHDAAPAAGEGWAYALAWRLLSRHNRFTTALSLECPLDRAEGLGPLDLLRVTSPALPGGDGTRGMTGRGFRLVELERDLAGRRARMTLLEEGAAAYGGFAPCFHVADWEPAQLRLVLDGDAFWPEELSPLMLSAGDRLSLTRSDAGGQLLRDETLRVVTADRDEWETQRRLFVTLEEQPAFAPQSGDRVSGASWALVPQDSPWRDFIHPTDATLPASPDFRYAP